MGQQPTTGDELPPSPQASWETHRLKKYVASMALKLLRDKDVKAEGVGKTAAAGGAKGRISLHNSFLHFKGRLRSQGLLLLKSPSSISMQQRHDQSWPLQLPSDTSKCSTEQG